MYSILYICPYIIGEWKNNSNDVVVDGNGGGEEERIKKKGPTRGSTVLAVEYAWVGSP